MKKICVFGKTWESFLDEGVGGERCCLQVGLRKTGSVKVNVPLRLWKSGSKKKETSQDIIPSFWTNWRNFSIAPSFPHKHSVSWELSSEPDGRRWSMTWGWKSVDKRWLWYLKRKTMPRIAIGEVLGIELRASRMLNSLSSTEVPSALVRLK